MCLLMLPMKKCQSVVRSKVSGRNSQTQKGKLCCKNFKTHIRMNHIGIQDLTPGEEEVVANQLVDHVQTRRTVMMIDIGLDDLEEAEEEKGVEDGAGA